MKLRLGMLAMAAALLPAALSAGDSKVLKSLKYCKEVEGEAPKAESLLSAEFDPEVYAGSGDAFEDLRLFSADSKEMPFATRRLEGAPKTKSVQIGCPSKVVSLEKLPDNRVEIVVERIPDLPESRRPVDCVSIETPTRNFEKRAAVYGLEESGTWTELCKDAPLFDYSDYMDFSRKSVQIPKSLHKKYRVSISNYAEDRDSKAMEIVKEFRKGEETGELQRRVKRSAILKLDGISLSGGQETSVEAPALLKPYALPAFSTKEKGNDTIVSIDTGRAPLRKLALETESGNFVRDALLEASPDGKEWRVLASAKLHRLELAGASEAKLDVDFPETRSKHMRLTIHNGDAPPLKISGLKAEGSSYCAEFIAKGEDIKGLKLYYGGEGVRSPVYDAASLIAKLKSPQAVHLKLGEQAANPLYTGARGDLKAFDSRIALGAVIVLIAALMGYLLLKSVRKIDSMPE